MNWRDARSAELWAMKSTEPTRVIALFRSYAGLTETSPLPVGHGFEQMINAVLDHEERARSIGGPLDTAPG